MRVDLRDLQPNPLRDFAVDPIDPAQVELLKQSIAEDGFWSGVVCRHIGGGTLQIAAGHHRVQAALAAGITHAEVVVREDMDEAALLRVYARENASARGMTSSAQAGVVASTVRLLAKAILSGKLSTIVETSEKAVETLRAQLVSAKGLGEPILMQALQGIPGISQRAVREHLASLKASGAYARILQEVQEELAREKADQEALETAKAAVDAAAQQERTFDFEGVAQHLRNTHQIEAFRKTVTGEGIKPYIPVTQQAAWAKRLAGEAHADGRELTGTYIHDRLVSEMVFSKMQAHQRSRQEEEHRRREALYHEAIGEQIAIIRDLASVASRAAKLTELYGEWPQGLEFPTDDRFPGWVKTAKAAIDRLAAMMDVSDEPPSEPSPDALHSGTQALP